MKNILILNAYQDYPFTGGKLNRSLAERAAHWLRAQGFTLRVVETQNGWDVDTELRNHRWADTIILQSPVNWMGLPWSFKKYMDEVYTAGMDGQLCDGDGRNSGDSGLAYGAAGTLNGMRYMLSLTFNAPADAFDNEAAYLFQGRGVDDLFYPVHMNFRFFGMQAIETFACYDVIKNPTVESDLERLEQHLNRHFTEQHDEQRLQTAL